MTIGLAPAATSPWSMLPGGPLGMNGFLSPTLSHEMPSRLTVSWTSS